MKSLNKVQLIGNLGADPEVRMTTGQTQVATLSVATKSEWKDQSGAKQEKTEWHRVILWKNLADIAQKYLKKGNAVYIEGSVEYRSWDDNEGNKKYITEIKGRNIIMLGGEKPVAQPNLDSGINTNKIPPPMGTDDNDDLPF